jgi:hypothetical protein
MSSKRKGTKGIIHDEFLIEYYAEHVLPLVTADGRKRKEVRGALEKFNRSKHNFKNEMDTSSEFYFRLDSLSRSLRFLGASEDKIAEILTVIKKVQHLLFRIPHYRDHLPHQLRVYLLGCYVLSEESDFFFSKIPLRYARVISSILRKNDAGHFSDIFETLHRGLECNHQAVYDAWALAGLCHDIGYAVEGVSRITDELRRTYQELIPELNMSLPVTISPAPVMRSQMRTFENCIDILYPDYKAELLNFASILRKRKDHGVWGCFFLTSKDLADQIKASVRRLRINTSNLTLWDLVSDFNLVVNEGFARDFLPLLYADALAAIAFHNKPCLLYLSPINLLLVVSDSLQEWNRIGNPDLSEVYLPRDVYLTISSAGKREEIDSEVYVYDCTPEEFYARILSDFDSSEVKRLNIDLHRIKKESGFLSFKFTIRVGPRLRKKAFSV